MKKIILFFVLMLSFILAQTTTETSTPSVISQTVTVTDVAGVTGFDFQGSYTNAAIDFTDVANNYTGSAGSVMIRGGTYSSPITSSDPHQSGFIRYYHRSSALTDDGTGFYDRAFFAAMKITGAKGAMAFGGLVEVEATVSGDGPTNVKAGEFIVSLLETGSKLGAASGAGGMVGVWAKIHAIDGATTHANSRKVALWVDNQMNGNNASPGEEYGIWATTGGLKPDAFIGFSTTSSGYEYLFKWDATSYDQDPLVSGDIDDNTSEYYAKVLINGVPHGIALFAI